MGLDVRRVCFAFTGAHGKERVRFADFNTSSRENAEAAGFTVEPMPESMRGAIERERVASERPTRRTTEAAATGPAAARPTPAPISAWAAAIVESEEAILRPDATATLIEIHSEKTMSVAMATAMLGALPIEHYHQTTTEDQMSNTAATAAITRAAEIRMAALAVRGDVAESKRLANALHSHSMGIDIVTALSNAGVDTNAVATLAKTFAH
jgi:hypothetical protein